MRKIAVAIILALSALPASAQTPAQLRDAALHDDVAWDVVEGLTTEVGQRLAATEAEARGRAWAVAKLKALGFSNVHVETFRMPVWLRGEETATVVSPFPQKLDLTALGNSGSTGPKGVDGDIVYFPTLADLQAAPNGSLKGKIAFVSHAMHATQDGSSYGPFGDARRKGPAIAASKGAAAILIRSIGTDYHRNPHTGATNWPKGMAPIPAAALALPDAEQLERMLKRGPVKIHLLLTPKFAGEGESGNVTAEVPGTDPGAGIVLVGGHLDSWDLATGAIDDAAGVAITTAAAKHILDSGRPRRTIRVVWFGAEEPGGFGGEAYHKAHAADHHVLAAESDFGADRVWRFESNLPAANNTILDRLEGALAPLGIERSGDVPREFGTDVDPTNKAGAAGIALSQTGLRYFDYHHSPDDTLDKIDPEQLRQNVAAWATMLTIVANAPEEIGSVAAR